MTRFTSLAIAAGMILAPIGAFAACPSTTQPNTMISNELSNAPTGRPVAVTFTSFAGGTAQYSAADNGVCVTMGTAEPEQDR